MSDNSESDLTLLGPDTFDFLYAELFGYTITTTGTNIGTPSPAPSMPGPSRRNATLHQTTGILDSSTHQPLFTTSTGTQQLSLSYSDFHSLCSAPSTSALTRWTMKLDSKNRILGPDGRIYHRFYDSLIRYATHYVTSGQEIPLDAPSLRAYLNEVHQINGNIPKTLHFFLIIAL